jgi:hydrogenase maturation protein HypF
MTSGNRSDEPIAFDDTDAIGRLAGIADAFLTHDRAIRVRADDSVARVVDGAPMLLRRSRGFAPSPLRLPRPAPRPLLAVGGQLKNTFCLAHDDQAVVSHHIGDLEDAATFRSWLEGIDHFERLFSIRPQVVAHDLHPEYLSTKHALEMDDVALVGVQHHHAHIASCLADNGATGPVVGAALDGFGWGPDGTMWGGELMVADLERYQRVGGLAAVPLPGGAAAVREPWRMAAAHLYAAYGADSPSGLAVVARQGGRWAPVEALARSGRCTTTSSAGRLFDAVAALVVGRDRVSFEGQAAIELEQVADPAEHGSYPVTVDETGAMVVLRVEDLVRAAAEEVRAGVAAPTVSARFHNGLADAVVAGCQVAARRHYLDTVALSGGVFQNVLLLRRVRAGLTRTGLGVLVHHRVPPNDGGLSLGQAAVAASVDAATSAGC